MIYFTKGHFAAELCFPVLSLLKQFLHYSVILLIYIYPNVIQILIGCNVLDV